MVTYRPTVADNIASLQRQINRINTAQMGPVTIAAGDGWMKMLGPDGGEVFSFDETGMYFLHRGKRINMSVLSDALSTHLEEHDDTLKAHDTRITQAQKDADRANTRLDGVGITLGKHDERIAHAGEMAIDAQGDADRANSRLDGVGITLGKHDERIANAGAMAGAAQSRADSAYSRAGDALSAAASAQSTANSAVSKANAAQSDADTALVVARKAAADVTALAKRVTDIENKLKM